MERMTRMEVRGTKMDLDTLVEVHGILLAVDLNDKSILSELETQIKAIREELSAYPAEWAMSNAELCEQGL